jgi:hypothetical protein
VGEKCRGTVDLGAQASCHWFKPAHRHASHHKAEMAAILAQWFIFNFNLMPKKRK